MFKTVRTKMMMMMMMMTMLPTTTSRMLMATLPVMRMRMMIVCGNYSARQTLHHNPYTMRRYGRCIVPTDASCQSTSSGFFRGRLNYVSRTMSRIVLA